MRFPEQNTSPAHLRGLVQKINITQRGLAKLLKINDSTIRRWLSPKEKFPAPYWFQVILENWEKTIDK